MSKHYVSMGGAAVCRLSPQTEPKKPKKQKKLNLLSGIRALFGKQT